jgi:glycosyltransferase involved in cell wall biosynthesis
VGGRSSRVCEVLGLPRLMVISEGSMQVAVLGRNAQQRLATQDLDGFFERVDYVFFRADESGYWDFTDRIKVHDVAGADLPPSPTPVGRLLRRGRILSSGVSRILQIADQQRPDVVMAVEPFMSAMIARHLARRRRIPYAVFLVSAYELSARVGGKTGIHFLPQWVCGPIEQLALRSADMVLTDRGYYRDYAVSRGVDPGRIRVAPCFADTDYYTATPDPAIWSTLGVSDQRPLVYVGRLSAEKYVLDLVEVLAIVRRTMPARELVLVSGGGPQETELLARAEALGCAAQVHIARNLTRHQIISTMAGAGVVLGTHAGFTLLEASLQSAPLVAYDFEWHPELIHSGETGILVPYRDAPAMAAAALRLLADPGLARRYGEAANRLARSRHGRDLTIAALRSHYAEMLAMPRRGHR